MLRDVVKSRTSATQRAVGRQKRTIIVEAALLSINALARDNICHTLYAAGIIHLNEAYQH